MTRKQLFENICRKQSFLCVGLDTDLKKVPQHLRAKAESEADFDPIFEFNKAIIDATAPFCMAYKPNLAFYEAHGVKGWIAFEKTVKYIREQHPDQFIIADAKRGDIGNTSKLYARTFFEEVDVDAVTVAPYMGEDSVTPFLGYPEKWVILLALTSNKGSADFQKTETLPPPSLKGGSGYQQETGKPMQLYERVILRSQEWVRDYLTVQEKETAAQTHSTLPLQEERGEGPGSDCLMYVVGATQGSAFADIRRLAPDHFLLVPGIGAQGGSLEEVCKYGWNDHCGLIVNSSRAIIYADSTERFAEVAAERAREVQQQMAKLLQEKAGNLIG
ncbi:MAG: orotidine-5'-phosphate decarboxylase [Bacteroidaceae bacterium]|nr:orotidine-5'-phosphate decarboxylase [Bacteroidaceae bacterium]